MKLHIKLTPEKRHNRTVYTITNGDEKERARERDRNELDPIQFIESSIECLTFSFHSQTGSVSWTDSLWWYTSTSDIDSRSGAGTWYQIGIIVNHVPGIFMLDSVSINQYSCSDAPVAWTLHTLSYNRRILALPSLRKYSVRGNMISVGYDHQFASGCIAIIMKLDWLVLIIPRSWCDGGGSYRISNQNECS